MTFFQVQFLKLTWREIPFGHTKENGCFWSVRQRAASTSQRSSSALAIQLATFESSGRSRFKLPQNLKLLWIDNIQVVNNRRPVRLELKPNLRSSVLNIRQLTVQIDVPGYILHDCFIVLLQSRRPIFENLHLRVHLSIQLLGIRQELQESIKYILLVLALVDHDFGEILVNVLSNAGCPC